MIDKKRWSLATGILIGAAMFIFGLLATFTGYGLEFVTLVGSVYVGFQPTVLGSFIGLVWGFLDAFIGVYIFLWIYEKLERN
jgi:hypothetical protein